MAKVKVLEVDQWTSLGNIEEFTLEDFDINKVQGENPEAVRKILVARAQIKEVDERQEPATARVWYKPGPDGKLKRWKIGVYDSSG